MESPNNNIYGTSVQSQGQCLKHTLANLKNKVGDIASERAPLCDSCSNTMLSYIILIQEVLDSLAKQIYNPDNSDCCIRCLRQESKPISTGFDEHYKNETNPENVLSQMAENIKISGDQSENGLPLVDKNKYRIEEDVTSVNLITNGVLPNRKSDLIEFPIEKLDDKLIIPAVKQPTKRKNSRKLSREQKEFQSEVGTSSPSCNEGTSDQQGWKMSFLYNINPMVLKPEPSDIYGSALPAITILDQRPPKRMNSRRQSTEERIPHQELRQSNPLLTETTSKSSKLISSLRNKSIDLAPEPNKVLTCHSRIAKTHTPIENSVPETYRIAQRLEHYFEEVKKENFGDKEINLENKNNPSLNLPENILESGKILPSATCQPVSINVFANNPSLSFELKGEPERQIRQSNHEAFVTMCRNNIEALECLTLGTSLRLNKTSREICVLVFDGVEAKLKILLSNVFDEVFHVVSIVDQYNYNLIEASNIFDVLHAWRLVKFSKCVFLHPSTLVIQNCDELFDQSELSAVPDVGWPDCFNSRVFVFVPSMKTFWELVEFAQKRENLYGGEQELLNSYFNSWSRDIRNKLSFIYNVMGSTTYTYAPAYNKFRNDVKIVQFIGCPMPWQLKFCPQTGEIETLSKYQLIHIRFFREWVDIFRIAVLKLFPREMQSNFSSHDFISAIDVLSGFLPTTKMDELIGKNVNTSLGYNLKVTADCLESSRIDRRIKSDIQKSVSVEQDISQSDINEHLVNEESSEAVRSFEKGEMDFHGAYSSDNIIQRLKLLMCLIM